MSTLPRPEYPRPHRVRERWLNLNGEWQFAFDDEDRGLRDGWHSGRDLPHRIVVPFSFEAELSGIGDTAAHPVVWYRRHADIPPDFLEQHLLLHVGASDFATSVWVNGRAVGAHRGGYSPLACEIQEAARPGVNEIVVRVEDRLVWTQPRGKQTTAEHPFLIDYDRTTGIWQTVWLEPVPDVFIANAWSHFHLDGNRLVVQVETNRELGGEVEAVIRLDGAAVARGRAFMQDRREGYLELEIPSPRLWSPDDPTLYDVHLALREGEATSTASTATPACANSPAATAASFSTGSPSTSAACSTRDTSRADGTRRQATTTCAATSSSSRRSVSTARASTRRRRIRAGSIGPTDSACVVWGEIAERPRLRRRPVDRPRARVDSRSCGAIACTRASWRGCRSTSRGAFVQVDRSPRQQSWVRSLYHLTKTLDGTRPVVANDGWHYLIGDIWGVHSYAPEGAELAQLIRRVLATPTTEIAPSRRRRCPKPT